jgi:hypothetical protein
MPGADEALRDAVDLLRQMAREHCPTSISARASRAANAVERLRADTARVDFVERTDSVVMCWNVPSRILGGEPIDNGWTIGSDEEFDDIAKGATWRETVDAARRAEGAA